MAHLSTAFDRTPELIERLVVVWERSVRATHEFLSEAEIAEIKPFVPQAIAGVETLVVAERDDEPVGFMGVQDGRLEMLLTELTVNEQNPQAVGFYEHLGFKTYRRTELDEEGRPYPLLYMRL